MPKRHTNRSNFINVQFEMKQTKIKRLIFMFIYLFIFFNFVILWVFYFLYCDIVTYSSFVESKFFTYFFKIPILMQKHLKRFSNYLCLIRLSEKLQ